MTLDGTQISYGSWTIPPGRQAMLTSIDSKISPPGPHSLAITIMIAGATVAQSAITLTVRQK